MKFNHIIIIITVALAFAAGGAHAQNVKPVDPAVVASTSVRLAQLQAARDVALGAGGAASAASARSARLAQLKATRDVVLGAVVPW